MQMEVFVEHITLLGDLGLGDKRIIKIRQLRSARSVLT